MTVPDRFHPKFISYIGGWRCQSYWAGNAAAVDGRGPIANCQVGATQVPEDRRPMERNPGGAGSEIEEKARGGCGGGVLRRFLQVGSLFI